VTAEGLPSNLADMVKVLHPALATLPRFGAAFLVLPLLARNVVSRQIRIGFVLVLAAVAYPHVTATFTVSEWGPGQWIAFLLKEMFIGALVGYAMGIMLWAIAAVGDLMDLQSGFQNAQIFNPFGGQAAGPFSALLTQTGVLLFIGYGGLHVFLQLLYESLLLWPPASFVPDVSNALRDFSIATSASLLETATRLAAPVIGALLIVELGIGLINRAAQQINTFYFSMPIKALTALLVLALMLSHLVDVVRADIGESSGLLKKIDRIWRGR
jgi:type III secretion protein T